MTTDDDEDLRGTRHEHESYGMLSVTRTSNSRGTYLFGTPVTDHFTTFRIRVQTGYSYEDTVGTGELRFAAEKQVVEVEMSPAQWLQAITETNVGDGVPCTITRMPAEPYKLRAVERAPRPHTETERAHVAFEKRMGKFGKRLDAFMAEVETAAANLSKKDQKALREAAEGFKTEIALNIPFFLRTFQEAAEKIVTSTKQEFEAWLGGALRAAGLSHLRQLAPGAVPVAEPAALPVPEEDRCPDPRHDPANPCSKSCPACKAECSGGERGR